MCGGVLNECLDIVSYWNWQALISVSFTFFIRFLSFRISYGREEWESAEETSELSQSQSGEKRGRRGCTQECFCLFKEEAETSSLLNK